MSRKKATKDELRETLSLSDDQLAAEKAALRRNQSITEQFRVGAQRICGLEIWRFLKDHLGLIGEDIAARFWIDPSAVSRGLNHGKLSLETLIMILSELELEMTVLPAMPARERRALSGYAESMAYCTQPNEREEHREKPAPQQVAVIFAMHRHSKWFYLNLRSILHPDDKANLAALETVLKKISSEATAIWGESIEPPSNDECRRLNQEWSGAFEECRDTIPYRWIDLQ